MGARNSHLSISPLSTMLCFIRKDLFQRLRRKLSSVAVSPDECKRERQEQEPELLGTAMDHSEVLLGLHPDLWGLQWGIVRTITAGGPFSVHAGLRRHPFPPRHLMLLSVWVLCVSWVLQQVLFSPFVLSCLPFSNLLQLLSRPLTRPLNHRLSTGICPAIKHLILCRLGASSVLFLWHTLCSPHSLVPA